MDGWSGCRLNEVYGGCMKQIMGGWNGGLVDGRWMVNEWCGWRLDEVDGGCMKQIRVNGMEGG